MPSWYITQQIWFLYQLKTWTHNYCEMQIKSSTTSTWTLSWRYNHNPNTTEKLSRHRKTTAAYSGQGHWTPATHKMTKHSSRTFIYTGFLHSVYSLYKKCIIISMIWQSITLSHFIVSYKSIPNFAYLRSCQLLHSPRCISICIL